MIIETLRNEMLNSAELTKTKIVYITWMNGIKCGAVCTGTIIKETPKQLVIQADRIDGGGIEHLNVQTTVNKEKILHREDALMKARS